MTNFEGVVSCAREWQKYFSDRSTIHGMRYVCMSHSFILRRIIWTFTFLACFVGFCVNTTQRFQFFLSDPINVNIQINYKHEMPFPGVTICNHNMFRATKAAEFGMYDTIKSVLNSSAPPSNQSWLTNLSLSFYERLAHSKQDAIFSCQFGGLYCNATDFKAINTDFGVCYTFRGKKKHDFATVQHSGASYGLVVTLNIEQYEYMDGPENTAGVKVLMHEKNEVPRVGDLGFNAPPGMQALIGIRYRVTENIPTQALNCRQAGTRKLNLFNFYDYSEIGCRAECEAAFLLEQCSCQPIDVPSPLTSVRVCSPYDERVCLREARPNANDSCSQQCEPTCNTTVYLPSYISYASISQRNAEKILVQKQEKVDAIRRRLLAAKEQESRFDANISGEDKLLFDAIFSLKKTMVEQAFYPDEEILGNLSRHLESDCFADMHVAIREHRLEAEAATKEIREITEQLISYDSGLLMTSYIQFMWDLSLRLDHLQRVEFPEIMTFMVVRNVSADQFGREIRYVFVRHELFMLRIIVASLQDDLKHSASAIGVKLVEHDFLLLNDELASYFQRMQNFTQLQLLCLDDLQTTMSRSFANIVEALQNFSRDFDFNRTQTLVDEAFDVVMKMRLRCQRGFIDHSYFDRGSMQAFLSGVVARMENDVREAFDRLNFSEFAEVDPTLNFGLETSAKVLATLEETIRFYQAKIITKNELALNLTSDEFSNQLALFMAYLSLLRTFIENKEDKMTTYADNVLLLEQQMPRMLLAFFATERNRTKSWQSPALTKSRVTACKAIIRNLVGKCISNKSAVEQRMSRTIRALIQGLRNFVDETKVDDKFVMRNFLQLSVFYRELCEELMTQQRAYTIWALLCDIGGGLSLFVGASFISCFELLDTMLIGFARIRREPRQAAADSNVATWEQQKRSVVDCTIYNSLAYDPAYLYDVMFEEKTG